MLGCPNLPRGALVDADAESSAASRSSEQSVGCLFAAQRDCGAYVGPLRGKPHCSYFVAVITFHDAVGVNAGDSMPQQRLWLPDNKDVSEARFMESYESAHSDQGFTSRLAKKLGVTKPPLRIDSQTKYGKHLASLHLDI